MGLQSKTLVLAGICLLVSRIFTFPTGTTENVDTLTELPVFYEVVTEEISITEHEERDSVPEETTTLWSATERPEAEESSQTQFPQPQFTHPDQQEIMNELHNIWYFSEGLNEEQNDLKSSLSSLVHMTYARVYDQQDETLGRLKHLLRQLRTKLLNDDTSNDELTTTEFSAPSESELRENETTSSKLIAMRKKRSSVNEEDIDRNSIFANANPNDNSLFPDMNEIDSDDKLKQLQKNNPVSAISSYKPTDQKDFQINPTSPLIKYETLYVETTQMPNISSTSTENKTTAAYRIESTKKTGAKQDVSNSQSQSEALVTVEDIISKIINVLQSPDKSPESELKPLSDIYGQKPILIKLKPSGNGFATSDKEDLHNLPSYLSKFIELTPSPDLNKLKSPTEIPINQTQFWPFKIDKVGMLEKSNLIANLSASVSVSNPSTDVSENTSTEMFSNPTKFLSDSILGMSKFINLLNDLSTTARLVLLLSIVSLILSIGLGFNSTLGVPIAVLGGLAFIIPIFLILFFQSNAGKFKSVKENILNNVNVEDVNRIVELLADAIEKYQ